MDTQYIDNCSTFDIRITELQRMIIAEALEEYNAKHKGEHDGRCIRDEANSLEGLFSQLDEPLHTDGINSFVEEL
jgi:hypothetical protein